MNRTGCERRVYRLATLLTGSPNEATRVIEAVVDAQPDLRTLDSAHLDRLTVLRSREVASPRPGAAIVSDRLPPEIADVLAGLEHQHREAWVFARVYRLEPREMARAMDCSLNAVIRHLELGDETVARLAGDRTPAEVANALREYQLRLDVPEFFRTRQHRRRWMRWGKRMAIALLLLALVIIVGLAASTLMKRAGP